MDRESSGVCRKEMCAWIPGTRTLCLIISTGTAVWLSLAILMRVQVQYMSLSSLGVVSPISTWQKNYSKPLWSSTFPFHLIFIPPPFPTPIKGVKPFQERKHQLSFEAQSHSWANYKPHLKAWRSWLLRLCKESNSIMYFIEHICVQYMLAINARS